MRYQKPPKDMKWSGISSDSYTFQKMSVELEVFYFLIENMQLRISYLMENMQLRMSLLTYIAK